MMFLLLQVSSPGQGFLSSVPVFSLSLSLSFSGSRREIVLHETGREGRDRKGCSLKTRLMMKAQSTQGFASRNEKERGGELQFTDSQVCILSLEQQQVCLSSPSCHAVPS